MGVPGVNAGCATTGRRGPFGAISSKFVIFIGWHSPRGRAARNPGHYSARARLHTMYGAILTVPRALSMMRWRRSKRQKDDLPRRRIVGDDFDGCNATGSPRVPRHGRRMVGW